MNDLGISSITIYKWIEQSGSTPSGSASSEPKVGNALQLAEEIKTLKKELARVKEEWEILKKPL